MTERCKAQVYPKEKWGSFHPHQCRKTAVQDGYCKIHHPDYVKAKQEASRKREDERWKQEWAKYKLKAAAPDLLVCAKINLQILQTYRDSVGSCDHQVGICVCHITRAIEETQAAIAKAEGDAWQ